MNIENTDVWKSRFFVIQVFVFGQRWISKRRIYKSWRKKSATSKTSAFSICPWWFSKTVARNFTKKTSSFVFCLPNEHSIPTYSIQRISDGISLRLMRFKDMHASSKELIPLKIFQHLLPSYNNWHMHRKIFWATLCWLTRLFSTRVLHLLTHPAKVPKRCFDLNALSIFIIAWWILSRQSPDSSISSSISSFLFD